MLEVFNIINFCIIKFKSMDYILGEFKKIDEKEISVNQALLKIADEVFVNAADQVFRVPQLKKKAKELGEKRTYQNVKNIWVTLEPDHIIVRNDGSGIPVLQNEDKVWIPQRIFGELFTSENYDDENEDRTTGGMNGIGVKLTNILSTEFRLRTRDSYKRKVYEQIWRNNMSEVQTPAIWSGSHTFDGDKKAFVGTEIMFKPDFKFFKVRTRKFTKDMMALLKRRVYDIAAVTPSNVTVHLNGKAISIKDY